MGGTIGCFPPLKVLTVLSGTMKFSPQGGGFQVRSSLDPLGPVSEGHGILINSDVLSASGGTTKGNRREAFYLNTVQDFSFYTAYCTVMGTYSWHLLYWQGSYGLGRTDIEHLYCLMRFCV